MVGGVNFWLILLIVREVKMEESILLFDDRSKDEIDIADGELIAGDVKELERANVLKYFL